MRTRSRGRPMRRHRSHRSPRRPARLGAVRAGALAGAAAAALVGASLAFATFNSAATGGPMTVSSKRIFSGTRSTFPGDLRDASSGGAANKSDLLDYDDAAPAVTGAWAAANSATRFYQIDFNRPRPAGIPASSLNFNIQYASKGGGGPGNACIYKIEVRRASDDSLLGTLDHSAGPLCSTGATYRVVNEDISSLVTTTDLADDLRIKVFGYETGAKAWNIEYATVAGTSYARWTLFEKTSTDQSTGAPTTTPWAIATAEGTGAAGTIYSAASNWPSAAPTSAKHLQVTFDHPDLAAGAVVQSVSLNDIWRSSAAVTNGGNLGRYIERYNRATL